MVKILNEVLWFGTDEIEELIDAVEHSAELSDQIKKSPRRWKWLILSLHQALQGACVCALRGTDTAGISVLTKQSAKEMWQWLNVDSRQDQRQSPPEEHLASMLELYTRVKKLCYLQAPHSLSSTQQMNNDIKKLNQLRNEFIHFVPKSFSLEITGMPRIASHCCDVIEHLTVAHPTFGHHMTGNKKRRLVKAISILRSNFASN